MDLLRVVMALRPDVTWKEGRVNAHSLETLAETYQSAKKLPTQEECEKEWAAIRTEDQTIKVVERARQAGIKAEKQSAGLKGMTVVQAHQLIDDAFAGATTVSANKAAVKSVLKKLVPYMVD